MPSVSEPMKELSAAARLARDGIGVVMIAGPTAVGKTAVAVEVCRCFGGEVVSVDSMQVYRGMDIGTAKPSPEELRLAPHHLIDIADPDEDYNLARFIKDAERACRDIAARGMLPVLAGGTGLYMRGFTEGIFEMDPSLAPAVLESRRRLKAELAEKGAEFLYRRLREKDPQSAARLHPNDSVRVIRALEILEAAGITWSEMIADSRGRAGDNPGNVLKVGLACDRERLYQRIDSRTRQMIAQGFREEVKRLLAAGYSRELKSMQSIGYRHMTAHILDGVGIEEAAGLMARDTRRYAKRQLTWFGREKGLIWRDRGDMDGICRLVEDFLENYRSGTGRG